MFTILTLYKNYTPHFFTFRNFYKKVWNINNFVYFVGYTTLEDYNYIIKQNINILGEYKKYKILNEYNYDFLSNIELFIINDDIFILYKTNFSLDGVDKWDNIKNVLFSYFYKNIYDNKKKYLHVDDDEFYFSTNINELKKNLIENKFFRFHFIEYIPDNNIYNLNWSYQSWWSHKLDKNNLDYDCSTCKTLFSSPSFASKCHNIIYGLHIHSGNNFINDSCCQFFKNNIGNIKNIHYEILNKGICYHWTGLNFKNVIYTKLKNRYYSYDEKSQGNYTKYIENYNKVTNIFHSVIDNTLLKYIDYKDIDLLRE